MITARMLQITKNNHSTCIYISKIYTSKYVSICSETMNSDFGLF